MLKLEKEEWRKIKMLVCKECKYGYYDGEFFIIEIDLEFIS